MADTLTDRLQDTLTTLTEFDQAHLLNFVDDLDESEIAALLDQIDAIDFGQVAELIASHVEQAPEVHLPDDVTPAPYYPITPTPELAEKYIEARAFGEQLIRDGKVAAFTVAGGQGTRLGHDGPKGTYPATPIEGKPLFQVFAEFIQKTQQKFDAVVPWYIMTSPINDADTRAFFAENDYFGLNASDVMFFAQGTMPSIGMDGRILLAGKSEIAKNPDGHGGSLRALHASGAIADMQKRGVEQISYFQVDNPNVKCVDPFFIGLHAMDGAGMSSKALHKTGPFEKVGNFALLDGRVAVIEYSDMPDELAEQRDESGELRFAAGSIAIHVIARTFVEKLNEGGRFSLPFHRAEKKVPCIDPDSGEPINPTEPNGVKLETFVFDALPLCETSIILETDRVEEFAPIKNATGVDSAESSKALQSTRAARWLRTAGVGVPLNDDATDVDAVIELSHLRAVEPGDLENDAELPRSIEPGQTLAIL